LFQKPNPGSAEVCLSRVSVELAAHELRHS